MARPVRVRPLSAQEDAALLQVVRSASRQETIRVRRAVMVRASAHGAKPPMIARLLDADPDTVRDVIHAFDANGLAALDPHWGPGCPRRITAEDEAFKVQVDTGRPPRCGGRSPTGACAGWSTTWPTTVSAWSSSVGNACGSSCTRTGSPFQRTRTWKESTDPDADANLDRIEQVLGRWPDRCFAFDQFEPLSIRPCHGTCWARRKHPDRIRATYHRGRGRGRSTGPTRRDPPHDHTAERKSSRRPARSPLWKEAISSTGLDALLLAATTPPSPR